MINNIKNEFYEILDQVQWMDPETREDAKTKVKLYASLINRIRKLNLIIKLLKASMMQQHIGFPDYISDVDKLDEEYQHVSIQSHCVTLVTNLILNILLFQLLLLKLLLSDLESSVN